MPGPSAGSAGGHAADGRGARFFSAIGVGIAEGTIMAGWDVDASLILPRTTTIRTGTLPTGLRPLFRKEIAF